MKINWKCNSCDGIYESLDVRFTKACDNNCPFCIEKTGLASLGETNISAMIKSVAKSGLKNILIVGGEPFLDIHSLYRFVLGVRTETQVENIYITTSLPFSICRNLECTNLFIEIMKLINGLNVSLQSTDPILNNVILHASHLHDRIKLLKGIIYSGVDIRNKVRVNLNLTKEGINSRESLRESVNRLLRMGVKCIKINELQDSSSYVSFEELFPEVKLGSPYSTGCQTDITDYFITRYQDQKILLKRSCFLVEKSKLATFSDLVKLVVKKFKNKKHKFGVLYENGILSSHWIKEK